MMRKYQVRFGERSRETRSLRDGKVRSAPTRLSPILSNMLLDKLDTFVETVLIPRYTKGKKRKLNQEYVKLLKQMHKLFKNGQKEAALKLRKHLQKLSSIDPQDSGYRRLKYIRYADDFGLAVTGPKSEAEEIKRQLGRFLREERKLNLSDEKTLVGMVNYYRYAYNLHTLHSLKWTMELSLTKTLAHTHHTSVKSIYEKYQTKLIRDGKTYEGLQVTIPREGKNPLVATWGGISLTWDSKATLEDQPPRQWSSRSELEQRLLAQVCEHCGTTHETDNIEVHHLRAIKDLNRYEGREKPSLVKIMAARLRKTLVLCRTCHRDLHAGRPFLRKRSRSRTEPLR